MKLPLTLSRLCAAALLMCAVSVAPARAEGPRYDSLYVFGDSLVDTGNVLALSSFLGAAVPPPQTFFAGRFSNGPNAVDYLWQRLSGRAPNTPGALVPFLVKPWLRATGAVNFAFGGTGTPFLDRTPGGLYAPGLRGQVELFRAALLGRRPSRAALYVIAAGNNDYRQDAFHQPLTPPTVVANITAAIRSMYAAGARHILVANLPDFRILPISAGNPDAGLVSDWHNALLAAALQNLSATLPGIRLIPVKLEEVIASIVPPLNPVVPTLALVGGGPQAAACLFIDPTTCPNVQPFFGLGTIADGFLFWDIVHPTTAAHFAWGDYLFNNLPD